MCKYKTLCSAYCKHNSGEGYYNLCQHPIISNQIPYGLIERTYVEGCQYKDSPYNPIELNKPIEEVEIKLTNSFIEEFGLENNHA